MGVYHLTIQDPRPAARCARSGWLQASLRLAKGWITFTNGVFDSREPPIWVPLTARPQVCVLVDPSRLGGPLTRGGPIKRYTPLTPTTRQHKPPGNNNLPAKHDIPYIPIPNITQIFSHILGGSCMAAIYF